MSQSLQGKNAAVTGGFRGIGAAIAMKLARRGASVLVTYVSSAAAAEKVVASFKRENPSDKGYAVKADCAKAMKSAVRIIDECKKCFPEGLDIVVNNAADGSDISLMDLTTENFARTFHMNILFPVPIVQQAENILRVKSRVVNISSISARRAFPHAIAYAASKAGPESITKSLAQELGKELQCTVNAVNPGPVNTDMWDDTEGLEMEAVTKAVTSATLASSRIGETDDIFLNVAFLCE